MANLIIVGGAGHAKVIADIVEKEGKHHLIGFIDEKRKGEALSYPILGTEKDLPHLLEKHQVTALVVGVGDNHIREKAATRLRANFPALNFPALVHPGASLGKNVQIGAGTVVMAQAVVNPCSTVGDFCIINTNASLDHDCTLGDFASLAPGATIGGDCAIGRKSAIGIGATILHGIHIGAESVIGAASLVNADIPAYRVAYGAPAKIIRKREKGEKYL